MAQILFTPLATEDLQEIWLYLAENAGSETANKFLSAVKKKCETVAEFAEMGARPTRVFGQFKKFSFWQSHNILFAFR